jgi:thiamine biosynthesis lipoprotein
MGTTVVVELPDASTAPEHFGAVEELFDRVQRSCTRFDNGSDLMRANASPEESHEVSPECAAIVAEAHAAYRATEGRFDPRILPSLVAVGYGRTFDAVKEGVATGPVATPVPDRSDWRPAVGARRVTLGQDPIDLGGIGKGWTVDQASRLLATAPSAWLVNAGGDLAVRGDGPDGDGWTVGIEDPRDRTLTLAVLRLRDTGCATSSTGRRTWLQDGERRHHLIDPRTGMPTTSGLQSVTVVDDSTMTAEVWSKALLIAGVYEVMDLCEEKGLAAYWVTDDGWTGSSMAMRPYLVWERGHDV